MDSAICFVRAKSDGVLASARTPSSTLPSPSHQQILANRWRKETYLRLIEPYPLGYLGPYSPAALLLAWLVAGTVVPCCVVPLVCMSCTSMPPPCQGAMRSGAGQHRARPVAVVVAVAVARVADDQVEHLRTASRPPSPCRGRRRRGSSAWSRPATPSASTRERHGARAVGLVVDADLRGELRALAAEVELRRR